MTAENQGTRYEANQVLERVRQESRTRTLPQTLADLLRAIDDPNAPPGEIGRIILRDAPLTVKILRLANSAIYGRSQQVSTVSQAIVLLGVRAVKALALSTAIYDSFRAISSKAVDLHQFWHHSLECGAFAQKLAMETGYAPHEEAFVAGLVHDIGILMLSQVLGDDYARCFNDTSSGLGLPAREFRQFGIDHAHLAAEILGEWGFPKHLSRAVERHHSPLEEGEFGDIDRLPVIVSLADAMSQSSIDREAPLTRSYVANKLTCARRLGFDESDLTGIECWVTENLHDVARYLDMDLGSPMDVLAAANAKLYESLQEMEHLIVQPSPEPPDEAEQRDEMVAMCALEAICATFSHYINNATTTILGRSELIDLAIDKGLVNDDNGQLARAMKTIQNSVLNISAVLEELKNLRSFEIVPYHERVMILNIDEAVKQRLDQLRRSMS